MLSNELYAVRTTQSVADALEAIEQKPFDVYVLDYKLPDGSGLDVAERIRSERGAAPIILVSGYDPGAVALRAEKLCISDFLEKPFSRETICNAVKKAADSPRLNRHPLRRPNPKIPNQTVPLAEGSSRNQAALRYRAPED